MSWGAFCIEEVEIYLRIPWPANGSLAGSSKTGIGNSGNGKASGAGGITNCWKVDSILGASVGTIAKRRQNYDQYSY